MQVQSSSKFVTKLRDENNEAFTEQLGYTEINFGLKEWVDYSLGAQDSFDAFVAAVQNFSPKAAKYLSVHYRKASDAFTALKAIAGLMDATVTSYNVSTDNDLQED